MRILKNVFLAAGLFAGLGVPALANVTVSNPINGAEVTSPFTLSANGSSCSNQPVAALGYSLDSSSDTTIVNATSVNAKVPASAGTHVLHVKSWGTGGAACVTDVAITVAGASPVPELSSGATVSDGITVSSPGNGATVAASFPVAAVATGCLGQSVAALGYSLDAGASTIANGTSLSFTAKASAGKHTLHVKSWGSSGAACDVDLPITVGSSSPIPAGSGITVTTPASGATVSTSFALAASAGECSAQAISAMGYSIDSGATTIVDNTAVSATVTTTAGAHTLHVKSWGSAGAGCDSDVALTVKAPATPGPIGSGIVVTAPTSGASVATSFSVEASATQCSSQTVTSIGYALDSNASPVVFNGATLAASIATTPGAHTLHVSSWGAGGAQCSQAVAFTAVASSSSSGLSVVPSDAIGVSSLQTLGTWVSGNDTATPGSSYGITSLVPAPTLAGNARQFNTTFVSNGGERYHVSFGDDTTSLNFLYDAWVYVQGPSTTVGNIEMDMNQTMANGQTAIFGFQCDGWNNTWDYTENAGTPTAPVDTWIKSSASCNPRDWTTNAWHHVQVYYSRTTAGVITYHTVWLDGAEQAINATVNSAFALGWAPTLLTNFQVDGMGASGSSTVYLDELTVYRW